MSALFEQILLVLVGLFRTFTKKIDKVVKRSVNKVCRKGMCGGSFICWFPFLSRYSR